MEVGIKKDEKKDVGVKERKRDPLRIFYELLYEKVPGSEMTAI